MNFHATLWLTVTIAALGASSALGQEEKQGDPRAPRIDGSGTHGSILQQSETSHAEEVHSARGTEQTQQRTNPKAEISLLSANTSRA
jgi:hypothetical protein